MANHLVGSFQLMKSLNKSLILNEIRTDGPISRAEIAKKTNLTPPTVTNIVGELLESKLVIESDLGASTGGRKPIMLQINASAFQIIGLDVGISNIKIVATNLNAEVIESLQVEMPAQVDENSFMNLLTESIQMIIKKSRLKKDTIMGIGVGMHGLVNPEKGISIYAPNLNLRNIPISEILEDELDIPVEVDNDVRAMALGESWFGHGVGIDNFICINVGNGVGAGIILDNTLYRGKTHTAGEMGHTTIDVEGPRCTCGNYGCLQALVAGPAIAARAQKEIRMGRSSNIEKLADGNLDHITGELIYESALQGDDLALEVLRDTGRFLGIGIANIINTLNPTRVIIGGGVSKSEEFIFETLRATVNARALDTPAKATTIVSAKLGDYATAIGAATMVLKKLFVPDIRSF
jgi:glucokinase-like ROK family protein